ncbi:MAG: hypothetical protein O9248_00740 [Rhodobacteraceae bacterium]|nr:hypothetical protein [Paracoccaceae bacterium]
MPSIKVTDDETFKLIRANLGDRYSTGFPILKELVQNAEDAGATELRFVLCPGWPEATHPLLQHPGMLVANDGSFRLEHGEKMLSFANSSKSGDAGAIGRFGFGQKAVFHLCDAFIIHAFGHEESFTTIANPCLGLSFVAENRARSWDMPPTDADLRKLQKALGQGFERGLLLWIPFRNDALLAAPGLSFTAERPNAESLARDIRAEQAQLTLILAASRNLRRILVMDGSETIFDQSVAQGSERLSKVDACSAARSLTGKLTGSAAQRYCAIEARTTTPELEGLKSRTDWPKTMGMKDGVYQDLPEKAEAHAALVLVEAEPSEHPVLRMDWGVFLPIGRGEGVLAERGSACEIALPKETPSLHILLHGYFFIDSGRRYVQGFGPGGPSAQPRLEERWNETLRDQVLLPRLPRLFFEARAAGILSDEGLAAVLRALRATGFWDRHQSAIVSKEGLGLVVWQGSQEQALAEYALLSPEVRLAPVPPPDQGRLRFVEALPACVETAAERGLVLLCDVSAALPPSLPRWSRDDLQAVLVLGSAVFRQGSTITALVEFLKVACHGSDLFDAATPRVLGSLRTALAGDAVLPANDDMRALFQLLRPQRCVGMPGGDSFDRKILKAFAESPASCIVVRGSWLPEGAGRSTLELPEAEDLFLALAPFLGTQADHETALEAEANAAALSLLTKIKFHLRQAMESERFARLHVMRLHDQHGRTRPVSLAELRQASDEKRLFLGTPTTNRALPLLSAALPRAKFFVLRNMVQDLLRDADLGSHLEFGQPTSDVIATLVRSADTLGDEDERIALMKHLGLGDLRYREALRILASGRPEARSEAIQLRVMGSRFQDLDGLMSRLLDHIDDVLIISSRVAESFGAGDLRRTLAVSELDDEDIGAHLERHADLLPKIAPTLDEIHALFHSRIAPSRLAKLPLFADAEGQLLTAAELIRETPALPIPLGLRPHVRFAHITLTAQMPRAYQEAIPVWSEALQIETAFAAGPFPGRAEAILDAIRRLGGVPDPEILRTKAWLTDDTGQVVPPSHVLDLPDNVSEAAARILPRGLFVRPSALSEAVKAHPALDLLRKHDILPDRPTSLKHLLDFVADYEIVALLPGQGLLPTAALASLADRGLKLDLPGWPLLSALLREKDFVVHNDPTEAFNRLDYEEIQSLRKALENVQDHGQAYEAFPAALSIFAFVFADLARQPESLQQAVLRGLKVPTKAGGWAKAEEIAVQASGIVDASLLHPDLASSWSMHEAAPFSASEGPPTTGQPAEVVAAAKAFAEAVRKDVPLQLLYLFFALIGIDPKAIGLLQTGEGAGPEEVRAALYEALQSFAASKNTGTFDVFLRHYRVVLQPAPAGLVRCKSLAGTWVDLPQDTSAMTLLRGNGHQRAVRKGQDRLITLTYDGAILAPDFTGDLVELIAAAIPVIGREALGIDWAYISKLAPLIEKARHVDQANVEATVRRLVSVLPLMLKQIKLVEGGVARDALRQAERDLSALARKGDHPEKEHQYKRRLYDALQNPSAQAELLAATRRKISDMGYSPKRILFELFQNADDAAVQAEQKMAAFEIRERPKHGQLDVIHWGRPINDYSLNPELGQNLQYDSDLLNMLQLNTSAKEAKDGVTGHFGLGFKSVHLIARSVYLGSGLTISTKISGGFLPGNWPEGRAEVRALSTPDAPATLIRLDLDPERAAETKEALEAFRKAATILPALGRSIRKIVLDGTRFDCAHRQDASNFFDFFSITTADQLRLVRIKLDRSSALLLRLDERGPVDFDPAIAGLWSLAPLEEDLNSGWILNIRDLPLDPGRTRLKEDPDARERRFVALGHQLAKRLVFLHEQSEKIWPDFARAMRLGPDEEAQGRVAFWNRLVRLFLKDLDHSLTRHLHGPDRGIGLLLRERAVLPSGLSGIFAGLIAGKDAQWCVAGELEKAEVQEAVSDWESTRVKAGRVISSEYADYLANLGFSRPRELRLVDLLDEEIKRDPKITPGRALAFGAILSEPRLKAVREQHEADLLRNVLGTGLFEMEDGSYRKAYLSPRSNPRDGSDEEHLLPFAPAKVVAASSYSHGSALDVYRIASERSGMPRSPELYAKWIIEAQDSFSRQMGLRYLLDGNLGKKTSDFLREAMPSWIGSGPDDLGSNPLLALWKSSEKSELANRLFPEETDRFRDADVLLDLPTIRAQDLLQTIRTWWSQNGTAAARKADAEVYPQGFNPKRLMHFDAEGDREGWFTFFALGSLQSIGRTNPGAHRSFVDEAMLRGWWTRISANGVNEQPEAWVEWLEDVATPNRLHIPHLVWHRRIVDLHLISTYLPDYVTAFRNLPALAARKGIIDLGDVMALSSSSDWQRLGLEGGPLKQSLGIGLNWMIREALRHGLWTGEDAARMHPYAWGSTARLRRLLRPYAIAGLGQSADLRASRAIHDFVCHHLGPAAHFDGALDLPLQLAATKRSDLFKYLSSEGIVEETDTLAEDEEEVFE